MMSGIDAKIECANSQFLTYDSEKPAISREGGADYFCIEYVTAYLISSFLNFCNSAISVGERASLF